MKQRSGVSKKRKPSRKTVNLKATAGRSKLRALVGLEEMYRPIKKPVTLRLDADILAWFKRQGRGYQTRINRALRKVVEEASK